MLNFLTLLTSLSLESMGQALSEYREIVDSIDSEQATDVSGEAIGNEEVTLNYPEWLKAVLGTTLVISNE